MQRCKSYELTSDEEYIVTKTRSVLEKPEADLQEHKERVSLLGDLLPASRSTHDHQSTAGHDNLSHNSVLEVYDWEPSNADDLRGEDRFSSELGESLAKTTHERGVLRRQGVEAAEDEDSSEDDAADLAEEED